MQGTGALATQGVGVLKNQRHLEGVAKTDGTGEDIDRSSDAVVSADDDMSDDKHEKQLRETGKWVMPHGRQSIMRRPNFME